ncbi:MAG: ribonuclease P protein component [Steroidobacteraceae bacterium]
MRFPAANRVLRKVDFESAYRQGRRHGNPLFSLVIHQAATAVPRLGMAIAAKTVGNAVARNKLRRIIRESFRHAQHRLPAADYIIGARAAVRGASAQSIRESLEGLWTQAAKWCAASSKS